MDETREDRIRRRAFEIWQREGGTHGRHEDHWRRAEAEIGRDTRVESPPPARQAPSDGSTIGDRQYGDGDAAPSENPERRPQPDSKQPDERPQTMAGALPVVRSRERAVKSKGSRSARNN